MVKTLTNRLGGEKRGKLDLVSLAEKDRENYESKLNEFYSGLDSERKKYEDSLNKYSEGNVLVSEKKNYGFSKGFRRGVATLAAIAGLGLASCGGGVGDPNDYKEPPIDNPDDDDDDEPVDPIPDTDYVDISGRLQDCETDSNQTGTIQVYDTKNPDGTYSDLLGEATANTDGEFSLTLNGKVANSSDRIYLRARTTNPSYIRTLELPTTDHNPITDTDARAKPAIRCVPYGALGVGSWDISGREADFKEHMRRVNFNGLNGGGDPMIIGNGNPGLKKWNKGEVPERTGRPIFKGIAVDSNMFSHDDWLKIKEAVEDSGHILAEYISNYENNMIVHGTVHQPSEEGWITVRHMDESPTGMNSAIVYDGDGPEGNDGYISKAIVYLSPDSIDYLFDEGFKETMIHEIVGHGMTFPGHADNDVDYAEKFPSNMTYIEDSTGIRRTSTFSPADIKANYLVDEETYLGMEQEEDILGL